MSKLSADRNVPSFMHGKNRISEKGVSHSPALRLVIFIAMLSLFAGCASINVANMVPDTMDGINQLPATVSLTVERGQKNGVEWYSGTIKPEEFEKAVIESLNKAGLFKEIVGKDSGDYSLVVKLIYAGSHPGFNMNAWVNAQWTLINKNTNETVWDKLVEGKGHATVGDAFVGAKRMVMALERGAKANIDEAIKEMQKLNL